MQKNAFADEHGKNDELELSNELRFKYELDYPRLNTDSDPVVVDKIVNGNLMKALNKPKQY